MPRGRNAPRVGRRQIIGDLRDPHAMTLARHARPMRSAARSRRVSFPISGIETSSEFSARRVACGGSVRVMGEHVKACGRRAARAAQAPLDRRRQSISRTNRAGIIPVPVGERVAEWRGPCADDERARAHGLHAAVEPEHGAVARGREGLAATPLRREVLVEVRLVPRLEHVDARQVAAGPGRIGERAE